MKRAYFAAGCFWGVEYLFSKLEGVKNVVSGYMGGHTLNPDYYSVCSGTTGHLEVVKVDYDENIVSYENLVKYFFEIHDFSQENGQGPDIGSQYLSAIFYETNEEKDICESVIFELKNMNYGVATSLYEVCPFYEAEDYHQDYYDNKGTTPYCHFYTKVFK